MGALSGSRTPACNLYHLMRVVRVLCRCRNETSNDMFFFLSFCFHLLLFCFSLFAVRKEVNEEGEGANSKNI